MSFLSMAIGFLFSFSDGRLHSYFYSSADSGLIIKSRRTRASDPHELADIICCELISLHVDCLHSCRFSPNLGMRTHLH